MVNKACGRIFLQGLLITLIGLHADAREQPDPKPPYPDKYVLDYPVAERCCPPIRSTFYEANRTFSVVRGRRFRHKPNGGFGLPIVDQVDGKNLLHVGADLGWYQVGAPVFAIASGVVRVSTGPEFKVRDKSRRAAATHMAWGNFIAIEHRFGDDHYLTTLYGHLGTDRRVETGDIVEAGEQIGTIGRKHLRINGGYTPHLHFGVRQGRNAEPGSVLMRSNLGGEPAELILKGLNEQTIEIGLPPGTITPVQLRLNGRRFDIKAENGKMTGPAAMLWEIQRPDFSLVGYALSTDGWKDPVRFLREHSADAN